MTLDLDVHRKACSFVIHAADGTVVRQGEIPTTAVGFQQLIGEDVDMARSPPTPPGSRGGRYVETLLTPHPGSNASARAACSGRMRDPR